MWERVASSLQCSQHSIHSRHVLCTKNSTDKHKVPKHSLTTRPVPEGRNNHVMPLESTVICLDNSEWMRNGDYVPTRLEAQQDAANLICTSRCDQNPENTVGILAMAGSGVELLVSPTDELGKLLAAFSRVQIQGTLDFAAAVQIAQLALKHRRNKNGGQRIIVFVGSPIDTDMKSLEKIGKQLKKNNVAVDVVSLGELDVNNEKLECFINAANSNDNSHLIAVPPGVLPSEAILSSPILQADGGGDIVPRGQPGPTASNFAEYGGVDPSLDPELAMAIRMSTEEARAAEEARARSQAESQPAGESKSSEQNLPVGLEDEDHMLQQALAMSMQQTMQNQPEPAPSGSSAQDTSHAMEFEDPELDIALRLSLGAETAAPSTGTTQTASTASEAQNPAPTPSTQFLDPDFVRSMLHGVDGVDFSDPMLMAALAQVTGQAPAEENKDSQAKEEKADKTEEKGDKKK